ncbi:hypothetical protein ADUPG1_012392, partial [Aduncisulcus paluster]
NLCCDSSHAVEIYDNVNDLLDVWFEVIKRKHHEWGSKYWSMLLSMFSTVPSLVLHISPRYDANMVWCKNNGAYNEDYSRYIGNCNPSLKKWHVLIDRIKSLPNRESTSKLYYEHVPQIYSLFHAYQSTDEIKEHRYEIILCIQCLRWFVRHDISENIVFLPIPDLNDLIDTFIDHLSRCEEVLEGDVDEEYCWICTNYTSLVKDKRDSFLPKFFPTFKHIMERESKEKLGGRVAHYLLIILMNISNFPSSSTRSSILALIKPYIRDWLRIYNDNKYYGYWMLILSTITLSINGSTPNKSICSDVWPLFHPVLDVVKREFVGDKIVMDNCERVLRFFSNLCCDPSHAVEVYNNVKDLLDGWFEVIKRKEHKRGIKLWSHFISMFSTVPSLVPYISPKYDTNMEWCNNNGGWDDDYSIYLGNSYPSLKKWSELVVTINKCPDSESTSKLYHEHRDEILSVFLKIQSNSEIKEHKREIVLGVQCLRWFVGHFISENDIYLPIPDLNDLIDTFIGHLSRCEEVLEGDVDEEYCMICINYSGLFQDKLDSFLPKISPTFQRILERGSKEKLGGDVAQCLLMTLRNISNSPSSSTRSFILTLIKPYIRDWLRIYKDDSKCYGHWMVILSHITLSSDDDKSIFSEAWPLFHPVLDIVKREFVGDKIVGDDHEYVLLFFSNLCCDASHALEIYNNVKDLLDEWFTVIRKEEHIINKKHHGSGIKLWSHFISMFSSVPSLVPHISPKYDTNMEWCKDNGGWSGDYSRYRINCYPSLKKWANLVESIKKSPDSESTSNLYHKHRDEILSVFLAFQSKSEIEEHKREIVLCVQCLRWFVRHDISGNDIYLPIPDLNDLIDTFIGHLSRCEEVLEGDVDEEYCDICINYTHKVHYKCDSFLPRISPTFKRILERGSKEKLGGKVALDLLRTLRNISISPSSSTRSSIFTLIKPYIRDWLRIYNDSECYKHLMVIYQDVRKISPTFKRILERGSKEKLGGKVALDLLRTLRNISISPSSSTRSSIFTLIKPYIRDWLRIYNDSECYKHLMVILSKITLSSDNSTPNESVCSEAWPLFHPVLDVVKREFVGDKIVEDDHEYVLRFFSNLCCDPSHAVEVYDNVKDLLDGWFIIIKKEKHRGGIIFWSSFISMFSTVPSLVPRISPKYDTKMEWCNNNGGWDDDYSIYLGNSYPSLKKWCKNNGGWMISYTRYIGNCYPSLKKWSELVESIKKSPDSESTSKLYHEHRDEILSVFLAFQSKSEIKEHKREIVLCVQCLQWFVGHFISGNDIYLPIPDLDDLIDTFIDHLSRCEEVLEGDVDGDYCMICVNYTHKVKDKRDSFLPRISPTFKRILERGSKEKLGGKVALDLLRTLRNISISPSSSTRSSIFTLIKPYIRDWLRIYNDSECYKHLMVILSKITLSSDNSTPNESVCSEAWPLFHPVLDIVKREFVGDKIVEDDHEYVLRFFSNLCCDPSHAVEVYDNVKDLLDGWFTVIKKEKHRGGIIFWSSFISMFSSVPSLVPHISPRYDANMEWCKNNGEFDG